MAGLISDQLLDQLRSVAYRQLITPVTIQRRTYTSGSYGSEEAWTTVETTTCWLKELSNSAVDGGSDLRATVTTKYELRLRQGTDIQGGDKVIIGGEEYSVQETNAEVTISLFLKAGVRKIST